MLKFAEDSEFFFEPRRLGEAEIEFKERILDDYEAAVEILKRDILRLRGCEERQPRHEDMIREAIKLDKQVKSDGGPTSYYDIPDGMKTLNDLLEWLAENRWGKFALHMKDIYKAGFRFGGKKGTEQEYDANKIIYFGCRILVMIKGKSELRRYLQSLLDDPQFK